MDKNFLLSQKSLKLPKRHTADKFDNIKFTRKAPSLSEIMLNFTLNRKCAKTHAL